MAWEKLGTASVSGTTANTSWKELGRTTLGSANATIDTGAFTAKDNIMILGHIIPTASNAPNYRVNSDTGSNYAQRYSDNGAADTTDTSNTVWYYDTGAATANPKFTVSTMINISAQEKLGIDHTMDSNASGAGNAPTRREGVSKWANTSAQITSVQAVANTSTFASGSEVVVLGCDNDEADSGTNFWQELGTATASGGETTLTATLSSSKKYLHYVMYKIPHSLGDTADLRINSNTGNVYAGRVQSDGGSDYAYNTTSRILTDNGGYTVPSFSTGYIVDTASKEKLVISESISQGTAGVGNTPNRRESVGKTSETARITALNMYTPDARGYLAGTYIKVYGAD